MADSERNVDPDRRFIEKTGFSRAGSGFLRSLALIAV
jgi:hypothetical protein